ncbi:MAG: hypothetical protein WC564_02115 [Patescibacteria group bacterium]
MMNEQLKVNYEATAKKIAAETVTTLVNGGDLDEAKEFAQKAINDWQEEGKKDIIDDFKKWLKEEKDIIIEE